METCYVVATLDTKRNCVTEVRFYSAEAKSLTTFSGNEFYFDVAEVFGRDYHCACVEAYAMLTGPRCPTYLRWVRPWIRDLAQEVRP